MDLHPALTFLPVSSHIHHSSTWSWAVLAARSQGRNTAVDCRPPPRLFLRSPAAGAIWRLLPFAGLSVVVFVF